MPSGVYQHKSTPAIDRLLSKVQVLDNQCWEYTGKLDGKGYSFIYDSGKQRMGHRVSYEHHRGPIPEGMQLDHKCHDPTVCSGGKECPHRRCLNPWHTEPATIAQNTSAKRSNPANRVAASKAYRNSITHCPQGHEYAAYNTMINSITGARSCRACAYKRNALYAATHKEKRREIARRYLKKKAANTSATSD